MSVRVGIGFGALPLSSAEAFWHWVDVCENSIIDSIWLSERLVSPQPFLEPLSALAAISGRTRRLKFGMSATVLPLRDPFLMAKECASIDFLSNGRLLPVFGVGNDAAPEWRALGAESKDRGRRSNEMLDLITRLWSEDEVSFHGKFYNYESAVISPKPKQSPMTLWIGGASDAALDRTARYANGWMAGGAQSPAEIGRAVNSIHERAAHHHRHIEDDHFGAGFSFRLGSWDDPAVKENVAALQVRLGPGVDPKSQLTVGGAPEVLAKIDALRAQGISKFVARPVARGDEDMIEQTTRLAEEVLPIAHKLK